jgi:hypothetical protein
VLRDHKLFIGWDHINGDRAARFEYLSDAYQRSVLFLGILRLIAMQAPGKSMVRLGSINLDARLG